MARFLKNEGAEAAGAVPPKKLAGSTADVDERLPCLQAIGQNSRNILAIAAGRAIEAAIGRGLAAFPTDLSETSARSGQ